MKQQCSEVAQILQEIECAYQAAYQGLHGYAVVAPHYHQTRQTEVIGQCFERLTPLVGETRAMELVAEVLDEQD